MTVRRYGNNSSILGQPVLHPATVDLKGKAYEYVLFASLFMIKETWADMDAWYLFGRLLRQNATKFLMDDIYRNPGPLQFEGPGADARPVILCVEDQDYMGRIKKLQEYLEKVCQNRDPLTFWFSPLLRWDFVVILQVRSIVKPGCSQDVVKAALSAMAAVTDILSVMTSPSSWIVEEVPFLPTGII